jgi:hypothetical protein
VTMAFQDLDAQVGKSMCNAYAARTDQLHCSAAMIPQVYCLTHGLTKKAPQPQQAGATKTISIIDVSRQLPSP